MYKRVRYTLYITSYLIIYNMVIIIGYEIAHIM